MRNPTAFVAAVGAGATAFTALLAAVFSTTGGGTTGHEALALMLLGVLCMAVIGVTVWFAHRDLRARQGGSQ